MAFRTDKQRRAFFASHPELQTAASGSPRGVSRMLKGLERRGRIRCDLAPIEDLDLGLEFEDIDEQD